MKVLLFYLFFMGLALASQHEAGTSLLDGGIVGGDTATIYDFPYQVSIEYLFSYRCGGSIIARTWILTAAHCVEGLTDPPDFEVRSGSSYRGMSGVLLPVLNITIHPNYSTINFDFDIALLQMAEPIPLSASAKIVALPDNVAVNNEGSLANVTGWGANEEGGNAASILKVIQIPVMSQSVCRDLYSSFYVSDRMFCAGLFEGGKDACAGDGGSPLVINNVLTGLVSWGLGCARPRAPGVYTNVFMFRNWITEITGI